MGGECRRRGYFQQRGPCGCWDGAVASHLPRGCSPGWPHRDYRTDFRPCTQNTLNLGPLSIFPFLNASNSTICGAKDKIFSTNFYLWICEKKLNRMFKELFLMHPNFDSPLGTQLLFNLWAQYVAKTSRYTRHHNAILTNQSYLRWIILRIDALQYTSSHI